MTDGLIGISSAYLVFSLPFLLLDRMSGTFRGSSGVVPVLTLELLTFFRPSRSIVTSTRLTATRAPLVGPIMAFSVVLTPDY